MCSACLAAPPGDLAVGYRIGYRLLPMSDFLEADGQAGYDMANLRPKDTGLPFTVWVSQKAGARHDIRVKVAQSAKVIPSQMGVYSVRPFGHVEGQQLGPSDEALLAGWIARNQGALIAYWNADIEYTADLMEKLVR
jgi:hypothetical protein